MLACALFLEKLGVVLGVRAYAESNDDLRELLIPPKPGTALRHARMFTRFQNFVLGDPLTRANGLRLDAVMTNRWISDLIAHKVGRYTPSAAVECLSFFANTLVLKFDGAPPLLKRSVYRYRDDLETEKDQAPPYTL